MQLYTSTPLNSVGNIVLSTPLHLFILLFRLRFYTILQAFKIKRFVKDENSGLQHFWLLDFEVRLLK